jgi:hypothetical protein
MKREGFAVLRGARRQEALEAIRATGPTWCCWT